jgi:hypothetical protein
MNRWVGLAALVALAAVGLYVALVQSAPVRVLPGGPEQPSVNQTVKLLDAGSLDDLIDGMQVQHALGGR